ncbi:DUF6691 family protein [Magnetospirillum molischianum]|uniref:Putative membrane protein permease family n=1 Tax=Magnetospirillum molischianum DSM 120 TaxID=1150626 RepID=H8FSB6_MAGML|nr:DUF6691 family protein [Magnetospirillum molischianum]CCG41254.1 putative membrane protein; permease family [Magnetospirillum molischianum DSM 120]
MNGTTIARAAIALTSGTIFGLGLAISGMIDPRKVLGFFDIFGAWDPSLAGMLITAIPVTFLFYRLSGRRSASLTGRPFPPSAPLRVDNRLIVGAALFGVGWGLAGLSPGPALEALAFDARALVFVTAMATGMIVHHTTSQNRRP